MKKAFITGITGQDGSYLAELLLEKGYEVHGLVYKKEADSGDLPKHALLHYGDLADEKTIHRLVDKIRPDEIYNLGADQSVQFDHPVQSIMINAHGPLYILEAIRTLGIRCKFFQAGSSEIFRGTAQSPQSEATPLAPQNPYGMAKAYAYWAVQNYRREFDMFAANGILYNHESPRRKPHMVTRKITSGVAEILAGRRKKIQLGNMDARRDWGYAPEYVEAMWRMLQQEMPDDYVIATGSTHSVRDFVSEAFRITGIADWEQYVDIDQAYARPGEHVQLVGDATKAKKILGWSAEVQFLELVRIMVEEDCKNLGVKI